MSEILKTSNEGVSIWLDDISRERLGTGNLEKLVREKFVVGVTSNPIDFAKALSKGSAYDEQVRDLAVRGVDVEEAVRAITTYDIRDGGRPVRGPSTGPPTASMAACPSRSTRGWPTTPPRPSPRPRSCTGWSTAPTC